MLKTHLENGRGHGAGNGAAAGNGLGFPATLDRPSPAPPADHLLKVAASIGDDAGQVWTDLWAQLRRHVTPAGAVLPRAREKGFTPACGWPEFVEQFWLLKHYIDSIERICKSNP